MRLGNILGELTSKNIRIFISFITCRVKRNLVFRLLDGNSNLTFPEVIRLLERLNWWVTEAVVPLNDGQSSEMLLEDLDLGNIRSVFVRIFWKNILILVIFTLSALQCNKNQVVQFFHDYKGTFIFILILFHWLSRHLESSCGQYSIFGSLISQ